uniref:C-type lectin domain-containing protein n=1 Tax=Chelonoidis abingdonii TaxID=106734 RepID=A0A8C0G2X3_CHEAB
MSTPVTSFYLNLYLFSLLLSLDIGSTSVSSFDFIGVMMRQNRSNRVVNQPLRTDNKRRPCPESWIQHGEKCYHFSKDMKTWHKSKEYCSSWGSLLLKIENKKELGFIKSHASFHWIGLSRTAIGHGWVWQDDTPGEKCALFKAGEAFSHNCTGQYRYICEKRATRQKTTELAQGR